MHYLTQGNIFKVLNEPNSKLLSLINTYFKIFIECTNFSKRKQIYNAITEVLKQYQ